MQSMSFFQPSHKLPALSPPRLLTNSHPPSSYSPLWIADHFHKCQVSAVWTLLCWFWGASDGFQGGSSESLVHMCVALCFFHTRLLRASHSQGRYHLQAGSQGWHSMSTWELKMGKHPSHIWLQAIWELLQEAPRWTFAWIRHFKRALVWHFL